MCLDQAGIPVWVALSPGMHDNRLIPTRQSSPLSSASTYVVTLILELSLAFNERFSLVMDLFDDESNSFVKLTDICEFFKSATVLSCSKVFSS